MANDPSVLVGSIAAAERRGMLRAAEIADPSDKTCQCHGCHRARQIANMILIRANAGTENEPPPMTFHDAAEAPRDEGWTTVHPKGSANAE